MAAPAAADLLMWRRVKLPPPSRKSMAGMNMKAHETKAASRMTSLKRRVEVIILVIDM